MWKLACFLISLAIGTCFVDAFATAKENVPKIAQCGGTIDADSDSLTYPDVGETLQTGEVCVWTIHLETTKNFKFNFTKLGVNSNYNDCRDGGVRIYSLTNLVPADSLESYTFCDKKPSLDSFFLGENVAVVVLYVGSTNSNPGTGFTLSWEGAAFDPMRTKHVSSFSSASNGIIRYPVIGHYEPNLAATWLIKSVTLQQTNRSDLSLESISLETCGNPDRCTCDALMLYEISPQGFLNESRRFCGESSGAFLHGVESRFILAFFTDFNTQPNGGGGFEVIYYSSDDTSTDQPPTESPTDSPTEYPTDSPTEYPTEYPTDSPTEYPTDSPTTGYPTDSPTTESLPELISTTCGEILKGSSGRIRYKPSQTYSRNERCTWTIKIPYGLEIGFQLHQSGVIDPNDGILVTTFRTVLYKDPLILSHQYFRGSSSSLVTMEGSVAIVMFHSDGGSQGTGFVLDFEAVGAQSPIYSDASKDYIIPARTSDVDSISHPILGSYLSKELSTFVFTPSEPEYTSYVIEYTKRGLESGFDYVNVFTLIPGTGWSLRNRYSSTPATAVNDFDDVPLYIFTSDEATVSTGFVLQYSMHSNPSTEDYETTPWI